MTREIAVIWMSAGNSYFTEENIGKLLNFADKRFEKIIILSPDKPAEHTFRALGYLESKAQKKARLNSNLLKNRAERALKKIKDQEKFSFIDWENDIVNNSEYKKKYKEIISLYGGNSKFRKDARETTKKVIENKFSIDTNVEKVIDAAVLYLIEELSFILACPSIYGFEKVVYLYHQNWKIYENLIAGNYDNKKREKFSFLLTGIK